MSQFVDSSGQSWTIDLSFGDVLDIRQNTVAAIDLLSPSLPQSPGSTPLHMLLATDLLKFYDLLQLIVAPQMSERGIDAKQFGKLMAADCLVEARQAFFDWWRDFFHKLGRPEVAAAIEKTMEYLAYTIEGVKKRMAETLAEIDPQAKAKIDEELNAGRGRLREYLDSTLARSRSDN